MNQRKQELEHNELADAIGDQLEKIKPYVAKIGIAIAILAAASIGFYWWMSTVSAGKAESWAAKIFASQVVDVERDPKALESVWKQHEPPASFWAMLDAGYFEMAEGNDAYIKDNSSARTQLKSAKEKFQQILEDADSKYVQLRLKARYLLAYAHESLGEFDDAKSEYQAVLDADDNDSLSELAQMGLDRVTDPKAVEMFEKYVSWEPSVAPADVPNVQRPDISFPDQLLDSVGAQPGGGGAFDPNKSDNNNGNSNAGGDENSNKENSGNTPPTELNPPVKQEGSGEGNQSDKSQGESGSGQGQESEKKDDSSSGSGEGEKSGESSGGTELNPPKKDENQ